MVRLAWLQVSSRAMPEMNAMPRKRWLTAGGVIVALAVGLVALAVYFAVSQSRALAMLRIAAARQEAVQLRASAGVYVRDVASSLLTRVVEHYARGGRNDPTGGAREPGWLGDVYVWDGAVLTVWPAEDADGGVSVDEAFRAMMRSLLNDRIRQSPHSSHLSLTYVVESYQGRPVVAALQFAAADDGRSVLAAVIIRLDGLRRENLDPHFTASGQLAVVPKDGIAGASWVEPLSDGLPLAIVPAPAFIRSQTRAIVIQATISITVAAVFLTVLLVMVWKLVRLVRREVALSQLKSNFVADVSHELKTPLALIRMFSEMLSEQRVPSEEKRLEYYRIITRESTRLTQLIDNILDFSKIDAGRKQYHKQSVDVGEVVAGTYEAYRVDLDRQGFQHALRIARDLPLIDADPDAIAQALLNLIGNAVKYSSQDKRIEIDVRRETRRDRHGVLISVTDDGIGISPEDRAHLFDGFFRASDERVRRVRGTGLGLSVVQHIVDAHGGSIDVESRLVKGSVFRIFLPQSASTTDAR